MSRGKRAVLLAFVVVLACFAGPSAVAETIVEAWSGPGPTLSVSVNSADGSCWVGGGKRVVHLSADGVELWRSAVDAFYGVRAVSVNSADGSCWVGDGVHVAHLSADGVELWRSAGGVYQPTSVSVNPTDGSCWVADPGAAEYTNSQVVHLSATGSVLWRSVQSGPNGKDPLPQFFLPTSVSVNPTDGSCWVADMYHNQVVHLSEAGVELWRSASFAFIKPQNVSVNSADGSCWVGGYADVAHLSADGVELWRSTGDPFNLRAVSVNSADGSCWVGGFAGNGDHVAHLSADGAYLGEEFVTRYLTSLSVNPTDGSCWVGDNGRELVVRLVIVYFSDVTLDNWAFAEVTACYHAGIVNGYADGTYQPSNAVTRDQMAVYISRALAGGDDGVPEFIGTPSFPDVDADHWALDYVEYAVESNVVAGYDDGYYHPEYQVTRDQMAVYVARAMVAPTGEAALADYTPADPRNFPDVPDMGYGDDGTDPFWAYTHIEYCVENGVVQGYDDGYYHPEVGVTRDQMAVYIQRAFQLPM